MGLLCFLRDRRLSRYIDAELGLPEYRAVQDHLRGCARCERRVAEFRGVDQILAGTLAPPLPAQPPLRLAVSVAVAAAFLASLALNVLLLRAEAPRERALLAVSEPPSETLSSFYARLSDSGGLR